MISNDLSHRLPPRRQPYDHRNFEDAPTRPRVVENIIKEGGIAVERKAFFLSLRENDRGGFLRIIESGGSSQKRDSVLVPMTGLKVFQALLADMLKAHEETPERPRSDNCGAMSNGYLISIRHF